MAALHRFELDCRLCRVLRRTWDRRLPRAWPQSPCPSRGAAGALRLIVNGFSPRLDSKGYHGMPIKRPILHVRWASETRESSIYHI